MKQSNVKRFGRKRNNNNNCGIFHDEEGSVRKDVFGPAKVYNENERDTGPVR